MGTKKNKKKEKQVLVDASIPSKKETKKRKGRDRHNSNNKTKKTRETENANDNVIKKVNVLSRLPPDALLQIFSFFEPVPHYITLSHVCSEWYGHIYAENGMGGWSRLDTINFSSMFRCNQERQFDDRMIVRILSAAPYCKHLIFSDIQLSPLLVTNIPKLCPRLTRLTLCFCNVAYLGYRFVDLVASLKNLKELDLCGSDHPTNDLMYEVVRKCEKQNHPLASIDLRMAEQANPYKYWKWRGDDVEQRIKVKTKSMTTASPFFSESATTNDLIMIMNEFKIHPHSETIYDHLVSLCTKDIRLTESGVPLFPAKARFVQTAVQMGLDVEGFMAQLAGRFEEHVILRFLRDQCHVHPRFLPTN